MRVLVTGGAGFIGSHLVEYFHGIHDVVVLDDFSTGSRTNLEGMKCEIVEGSVLDRSAVHRAMRGVRYVFHLAAMVSVPESVAKPDECRVVNSTGTQNVLNAARAANVKRFIFSSSSAVYGDNPAAFKDESLPPTPKSPYASSKLTAEGYCAAAIDYGLSTVCLRYFNVFGPRQKADSAYAAVVPSFIQRALRNEPLVIHGDGEQVRDFVFVKDVAAVNHFFAQQTFTGIFNVGCGQGISIYRMARMICDLTESNSKIVHEDGRPGDVRHSVSSAVRLMSTDFYGFRNMEVALRETIHSVRQTLCEHDWEIVSLGDDPAPVYCCSACDKVGGYVNY